MALFAASWSHVAHDPVNHQKPLVNIFPEPLPVTPRRLLLYPRGNGVVGWLSLYLLPLVSNPPELDQEERLQFKLHVVNLARPLEASIARGESTARPPSSTPAVSRAGGRGRGFRCLGAGQARLSQPPSRSRTCDMCQNDACDLILVCQMQPSEILAPHAESVHVFEAPAKFGHGFHKMAELSEVGDPSKGFTEQDRLAVQVSCCGRQLWHQGVFNMQSGLPFG